MTSKSNGKPDEKDVGTLLNNDDADRCPAKSIPGYKCNRPKGHDAAGYGHYDWDTWSVWFPDEEAKSGEDFWTQHPYGKAIEIVKTGFGDQYVLETRDVYQKRPIRRVFVDPCDTPPIERAAAGRKGDAAAL